MKRLTRLSIVALLLVSACSSDDEALSTSTSTSPVATTTATTAATTTTATVVEDLAPSIGSVTIGGTVLNETGGRYALATPLDPGDRLQLEVVVVDDEPGELAIADTRDFYPPSPEGSLRELTLIVPDGLTEPSIPILLNGDTAAVIAFEPGPEWPPTIVAGEILGYAGVPFQVQIEVVDLNGDPVDLAFEQVLGLGDRYTGSEYVTSRPIDSITLDRSTLTVESAIPGNFRFALTANDGDHSTTQEFDIPIYWAPGENPWEIRGIAIDFWGPPSHNDLRAVSEVIRAAADMGANWLQIAPNWHIDSVRGSTILPCSQVTLERPPCVTPTDGQLSEWIELAHDLGLSVLLKPHLVVGGFDNGYDGDMWQIRPSDLDSFFDAYEGFIVHHARLAENLDVEMFAVGNEHSGTQQLSDQWREVAATVRSVYGGPLTYSDVLLWQIWDGRARFWDALDVIGVPYYYPGSDADESPTVAEMVDHIESIQATNFAATAADYPSTPIMATEMGRPNFDGTNHEPWDWTDREVDNQELVDWVEAAFLTQLEHRPRFLGTFMWVLKARDQTFELDWDFRGKPLEEALRFWFAD